MMRKTYFFIPLLIVLQACTMYPSYERPCMEIPETFRISTDESSTYANIEWWQRLNDPVLDALIIESLENNNDLKVAIARVDAFAGHLLVTRSPLFPQLSGNASYSRQELPAAFSPTPLLNQSMITNTYMTLLNLSYDIDLWGKYRSASDAALAELLGSIETRRSIVLNLVTAVASAYIQLRQFDLQLNISRKTLKSRQESYELAKDRFIGGLTSELEAKQSEAEMETSALLVIEYELAVETQENLLSVLVGHPPRAIDRGLKLDAFVLPPNVPTGIPSDLLEQRPDILEAEQTLIANNALIGVARANFFPSISLTGLFGQESLELKRLFTGPNRTWQYMATLAQPIFTGWSLTGQLEEAKSNKMQAYYQYRQVVLTAFKEVDDALIAHKKSQELVVVGQSRTAALNDALYLANLQYENGQVDYLNVLDAMRNLLNAELDLAGFQGETFLSLIGIYKALGGGWVTQVDSQNNRL